MHILEISKLTNADIQKEELAYLSGDENFKFLVEDRTRFLMDQLDSESFFYTLITFLITFIK